MDLFGCFFGFDKRKQYHTIQYNTIYFLDLSIYDWTLDFIRAMWKHFCVDVY